ncbi:tubulin monoglutamylase TTLL4-like [Amphiura filiformis]|uniref:tubulin monoglutamylase TTLL4-like n=1 Tax=Amphiura filiformis TaxID=82378 RepID=UPI003B212E0B
MVNIAASNQPRRPFSAKGVEIPRPLRTPNGAFNHGALRTAPAPPSRGRFGSDGSQRTPTSSFSVNGARPSAAKTSNRIVPSPPQSPNKTKVPYSKAGAVPKDVLSKRVNGDGMVAKEWAEEDGEEWSDVDEADEDGLDTPASERLPGDGASYDDLEEDDGMDGLDEDGLAEDDESDGYSIASTDSRRPSAGPTASAKRSLLIGSSGKLAAEGTNEIEQSSMSLATRSGSRLFQVLTSGNDEALPALTPSLFSRVPPTVNFVSENQKVMQLPWDLRKMLKWRMSNITPQVIKHCIARSGFRASRKANEWLGYWGKHMKASGFKVIKEYQKVNHLPGSFQIGRKDRLWRNLSRMQVHFGKKDFGFVPQTFCLPFDMKLLKRAWEDSNNKQKWILKPPASARGIGIRVIHKWSQIPKRKAVIVQRYLHKPFLINGSKFDLRIYVYVTCYDPLRIYIYPDGLTRFATMKYSSSMKSLSNRYMHLTNYTVNKKNSDFMPNEDHTACEGHKWTLKALWSYMKHLDKDIDTNAVWENIKDIIIKTIISVDSCVNSMVKANVKSRYSVHELFGFDVMLDENLKPWVIEVNISPSLHSNSPLDVQVKGEMIKDLFNIAGYQLPDKKDVYPNLATANQKSQYSELFMDKRLYTLHLNKDERAKHAFYTQKHLDEQCRQSVLDTLTPDDIRVLIETEDEFSRCGGFERVFPSPTSGKYHRFFENHRYFNILVDEWVKRYHRMPSKGIALLDEFCAEGVHLGLCKDNSHVWTPVSSVLIARDPSYHRTSSAPSTSTSSPTTGLKKSSSANSLPKIRRRISKARSVSSNSMSSVSTFISGRPPPHPPEGRPPTSNADQTATLRVDETYAYPRYIPTTSIATAP